MLSESLAWAHVGNLISIQLTFITTGRTASWHMICRGLPLYRMHFIFHLFVHTCFFFLANCLLAYQSVETFRSEQSVDLNSMELYGPEKRRGRPDSVLYLIAFCIPFIVTLPHSRLYVFFCFFFSNKFQTFHLREYSMFNARSRVEWFNSPLLVLSSSTV